MHLPKYYTNNRSKSNKIKASINKESKSNINTYIIENLDTQFDNSYSSIATRQCSWFCHVANHFKHKLLDYYLDRNLYLFEFVYKFCLHKASVEKKNSPDRKLIETIFHPNITEKYSKDLIFFKMSYNLDKPDTYSSLPYDNAVEVLNKKKSYPEITKNNFVHCLENMSKYNSIIINRCIMSFVLIKISDSHNDFLLIDPHFSKSYCMNIDEILEYIDYTNDQSIATIGFDISQ